MRYIATRLPAALITFILGITVTNVLGYVWPGASGTADEAAVLRVENEYLRANREGDVPALDRVLADDFTSFGGRVTKEHRLALLSNPYFAISSLETSDVTVNVSGDEAWVSGRARMSASFQGRDFTPPPYGFTRHYERRDGRWQIISCSFRFSWWK